jgi:hypothetical protein
MKALFQNYWNLKRITIVSLVFLIYIVAHVFGFWNLHRLQEGISSSQVNFPEKKVRITYNSENIIVKHYYLFIKCNWL